MTAATRQRRHRQREKEGLISLRLDVHEDKAAIALVKSGRRSEEETADLELVQQALQEVVDEWIECWFEEASRVTVLSPEPGSESNSMTNSAIPFRRPLVPEDRFRQRASDDMVAAICADLMRVNEGSIRSTDAILREYWTKRGDMPRLHVRAATAPASLTTSGWADLLASTAFVDLLRVMGGAAAMPGAFARGIALSFDNAGKLFFPGVLSDATNASFVQEAQAIPVRSLAVAANVELAPRKMATIIPFSRQIFKHSIPAIEAMVRLALSESVGPAIDTISLDANAGDEVRPAGLRYNKNAETASDNTDTREAMDEDMAMLFGAVAPVAGNNPVLFIASRTQAARMRLRARGAGYEVFASSALTAGTVIAIASNVLISAVSPAPRWSISGEATLVMDDNPGAISEVGTPNTVAVTRNLLQTDTLAMKMLLDINWGLRSSTGIAWVQNAVW